MPLSPSPDQDFFTHYAEAVLITKEDNTPVFINPAFTTLTGFASHKLHLINPTALFGKENSVTGKFKGNITWETGLTKSDSAVLNVTVSLSKIILSDMSEGRVYTIKDNSAIYGVFGLLKESEKRLIKAKNEVATQEKELIRTHEELEQFVYVTSHDMQEPLRMVASYIQLIQKSIEKQNTENVKEFMKFVLEGAERMQSLITDLLQFSRVNSRGNAFAETDLNELVSIARVHLANQVKEGDVKITVDALPKVYCDSSQILRVFQNLLDNAIKFKSPDRKPEIQISVEENEPDYLFSVRDNGIGIADKHYARIFVIFQRLHSATDYEGTGVGLAVSKKIIERHGGNMWVESEVGVGSTFYFTLKKII